MIKESRKGNGLTEADKRASC